MDLGLSGRVALVTGSWRGTGAGTARVLASEGATVLVHGFETGACAETIDSIRSNGGIAHEVVGDIRNDEGTRQLRAEVDRVSIRVDIVVNNYGVAEGSEWPESDASSWHSSYDTNVVSAIRVTNEFVDGMRSNGWGRIVFVSTVGATRPGERIPEYYAAKGCSSLDCGEFGEASSEHWHHRELCKPRNDRHSRGGRIVHEAGGAQGN